MKTIVFLGYPCHGHTNPTLAFARELSNRGMTIIYYNNEPFREKIEAAGLEFRPYHFDLTPYMKDDPAYRDWMIMYPIFIDSFESIISQLESDFTEAKPDCIIHDSVSAWGKLYAAKYNIPAVASTTTFAYDEKGFNPVIMFLLGVINATKYFFRSFTKIGKRFFDGRKRHHKLAKECNLPPSYVKDAMEMSTSRENLNIVFTSKEFQILGEVFGEHFKFVGPSIQEKRVHDDNFTMPDYGDKPLIYITLGTIYNDRPDFYHTCVETFKDMDVFVIMSVGPRFDVGQFKNIPDNMIIKNHVPQLEILSKAALSVAHGGMNTISEAMLAGVPIVCYPQLWEQDLNANQLVKLNAGLKPKKQTPQAIREAVETVLGNPEFKEGAKKIGDSFRNAGGFKYAADSVEQYLEKTSAYVALNK